MANWLMDCITPIGCGKWEHADAILHRAYPDAFEAEIAKLGAEGGRDAGR